MKISFFTKNSHIYLFFFLIFAITLLIRLSFVGLVPFWREDGFQYFVKAEEILEGNFTPKMQEMGLSFFYSFFLVFLGQGDIFKDLRIAQILQAIVESFILLPLFLIALKLFNWKSALLASLFFAFWPGLIHWTSHGYSEGLFIFLALFSFYFLISSGQKKSFLFLGSAFAGLAFCVRVTGIFLLPAILLFAYVNRRKIPKWKWHWLILVILVFILVVSPYLILRFSSSEYPLQGRAGRYIFVDVEQQLFDPEINPSLSSFLSTHSLQNIFSRALRGMTLIVRDMYSLNQFLVLFTIAGLLFFTRKKFLGFHFVYLSWFVGHFWIYAAVRSSRLLLPLLPFSIILTAGILIHIFGAKRKVWLLSGVMLVFFMFSYSQGFIAYRSGVKNEGQTWKDALSWGMWMEKNIPSTKTLAIREGIDIVSMMAPRLKAVTIPQRSDLDQIYRYFKKTGICYFAVGSGGFEVSDWNRIPALKQIRKESLAPFLIRIYYDEGLRWPMEIFKINWDKEGFVHKRGIGDEVEAESLTSTDISRYDSEASNEFSVIAKEASVMENSILLGSVKKVPPGRYRISFSLKAKEYGRGDLTVQVSVLAGMTGEVLSKMKILGDDFREENIYQKFDCFLDSEIWRTLNFRITAQGQGELCVDNIKFASAD